MKYKGLKGSEFENLINNTIDEYRHQKIALITKIPTPITPVKYDKNNKIIKLAYFAKKSTVDYVGVVQEIPICFDAKECDTFSFKLSNIKIHQFEYMKDFEEQGGISFILILFKKNYNVYYLTFKELDYYIKNNIKVIEFSNLKKEYIFDIKNRLKVNFLEKMQIDIDSR